MNRETFIRLIDSYGATPDRWPADIRAEAAEFAADNPDVAQVLGQASAIDALLDRAVTVPTVSTATLSSILAVPDHHQQAAPRGGLTAWLRSFDLDTWFIMPRLVGMAAAAVLGFYVGTSDLVVLPSDPSSEMAFDLTDLVFDTLPAEDAP